MTQPLHPTHQRRNLLCVDDHAIVRESLVLLLSQRMPELRIFEAGSLMQTELTLRTRRDIDLVLLDLDLPDSLGLETLDAVRRTAPAVPVVVVSSLDGAQWAREAVDRGAAGFIHKTARSAALLDAVQQAVKGGVVLPPALVDGVQDLHSALDQLSNRQRDVLRLLVSGLSNRDIAAALMLSEATVKTHVNAVYRRLNVSSRTQAVMVAARAQVVL